MVIKGVLATSQHEQLLSVDHLSKENSRAYFSFPDYDLEVIDQYRGKVNKLGFAIQPCSTRHPGYSLSNWPIKSAKLASYVSQQLYLDAIDLNSCDHRNTRANHFSEILEVFNYYRLGSANTQKQLIGYLVELALENDDSIYLMEKTIDFLARKRIVFPSIAAPEDIISRCRGKTENNLSSILLCSLVDIQIEKLENLFQIYEETKMTKLAWLKDVPGKANPESLMSICKEIEVIASMGLGTINISHISRNKSLRPAGLRENYSVYGFSHFELEERYSLPITFLINHHQYLIDQLIEINDRILASIKRKGTRDSQEQLKEKGKLATRKSEHYASLIDTLHFAENNDSNPFDEIEWITPWEGSVQDEEEAKKTTGNKDHGYLEMVRNRVNYLWRYTPMLLKTLSLKATPTTNPVLMALTQLADLHNSGKRKIPADTSTDFVSKERKSSVRPEEGKIDRSYYELVAFTELKDNIWLGDTSVEGSMIHRNIDGYLVDLSVCIGSEATLDTSEDHLKDREIISDLQL